MKSPILKIKEETAKRIKDALHNTITSAAADASSLPDGTSSARKRNLTLTFNTADQGSTRGMSSKNLTKRPSHISVSNVTSGDGLSVRKEETEKPGKTALEKLSSHLLAHQKVDKNEEEDD